MPSRKGHVYFIRLFPGRGSGKLFLIIDMNIYNFTRCTGGRRHVGTQFMDTGKQVALLFGHRDKGAQLLAGISIRNQTVS